MILLVLVHISSFKININKITLSSNNMSQDQIARLASMLDCKVFDSPFTYLGLPLGGNQRLVPFGIQW